jgi:LPS sulfotransferase NodH
MFGFLSKKKSIPKLVIMFHIGRSGSTVLGDLLNQHKKCHWDGEIYEDLFQKFEKANNRNFTDKDIIKFPEKYTKSKCENKSKEYYGFEVKFFHLKLLNISIQSFIELFNDYDVSFIILRRNNFFRKVISSQIAHKTKIFHLSAKETAKLEKVVIDVNSIRIDRDNKPLLDFLNNYKEMFDQLDLALKNKKYLKISFEEDIERNPIEAYNKICNYLGIKPLTPQINYQKTTPFNIAQIVTNINDVEAYLKDTPFYFMTKD